MLNDCKSSCISFYLNDKSQADQYLSHRNPLSSMEIGGSQHWGIPFDIDGMAILWIIRMRCRNPCDI